LLELYHFAFSTCSQKVRLVLAEKNLDFVSHEVDLMSGGQHDPEYVKLNPNHVVPTLVDDGVALIESTLINEYLDDAFPQVAMRPADARGRHHVRLWTKRLDEKVHPATAVVTFAISARPLVLQLPEEVREANINSIPDAADRKARRSVIEHGVDAPEFAGALKRMIEAIDQAEKDLAQREWLSGGAFGLADACLLPYVLRLDHMAMSPLLAAEVRPSLARWYKRTQARPAYEVAVTKWAPEPVVQMLKENGKVLWPQVERVAANA